jgi:5-methylcytosine-specific restriction endonuclease McrA
MLSSLFKLALEKNQDMKASAPDVKINTYSCRLAYTSLFDSMFMTGLSQIIQNTNEMKNDYPTFNNFILNNLRMNRDINDCNKKYQPSQNELNNFMLLNNMNEHTKNYITKLCDVILDDNYDISKENDKSIITYYCLLKYIPIYFDIISGCYKYYDDGDRFNKCNDINKIIDKMGPQFSSLKININTQPNYMSVVCILKDCKDSNELNNLILKYNAELNKLLKYKSNGNKKDKVTKEEVEPVEEKSKTNKKKEVVETNEAVVKETDNTKKPKKKKEKIPAAVRKIVWNTYIGKDNPIGKCLCCSEEDISSTNFECGHIKSEKNGGEVTIENLRPICGNCNKSIGGNNMDEFMDRYKIKKPKNWNGLC